MKKSLIDQVLSTSVTERGDIFANRPNLKLLVLLKMFHVLEAGDKCKAKRVSLFFDVKDEMLIQLYGDKDPFNYSKHFFIIISTTKMIYSNRGNFADKMVWHPYTEESFIKTYNKNIKRKRK